MSKSEEERALLACTSSQAATTRFSAKLSMPSSAAGTGAQRIYGYTAERNHRAAGNSCWFPPRSLTTCLHHGTYPAGESIDHYETLRRHKDGSFLYVTLTVSPIRDRKGEIVGASTIARDMTSRRLAEEALRASEKLVAMGRMAASIAHEIRNPLDAAKNITYLLQQKLDSISRSQEMLGHAGQPTDHMGEICSRTLSFARPGDAASRVAWPPLWMKCSRCSARTWH